MFVCRFLTITWSQRKDCLRQEFTMLPLVSSWIIGKICQNPHTVACTSLPLVGPLKPSSVGSRASNASLFVMSASSPTVALPSCITLLSAVPF